MYYLLDHLSIAAEDSQRCASVVRRDVIFLSTAHLHGEQMTLIMKFKTLLPKVAAVYLSVFRFPRKYLTSLYTHTYLQVIVE